MASARSSSTTTTVPGAPTTTLPTGCTDVSQAGRFAGGFARGNYDVFCFELTERRVLTAETSNGADGCPGDTILELRRSGMLLASDDESGPGHCSRLQLELTEPGDYEIRVSGFAGAAIASYVLDVELRATECGNGLVEQLEQCDDGNVEDGDCCASDCTREADASPCSDGLLCDGDDSCSGGFCIVHTLDPCPGVDGDSNCSESCSDTVEGCESADPDASPCDDGLFCDGLDRCSGGVCATHNGDPCRGPDGDGDCAESCKESSDSCSGVDPNGTVCDDGLFCNGADQCQFGTCSVHAGNACTGPDGDSNCAESCSESRKSCSGPDPNGSACNDGLFCTGADTCSGGTCSMHAGNACKGSDGDSNCVESCNEAAKNCAGSDPNGSPCNDGLFCNGSDTCSGGSCSVHSGNPCAGADGDGNCSESCNESADSCTAADANASPCNDGLFCNGPDTCSGGSCSVHSGNPCAGADGDGNCSESCNESADNCGGPDPGGSSCDDGLACNAADSCSNGFCTTHAGTQCPGADGDSDCAESCSDTAAGCTSPDPPGSACETSNPCSIDDHCDAAGVCVEGTLVDCDDDDPCTTDACIKAGPHCTHLAVPGCVAPTTTTLTPTTTTLPTVTTTLPTAIACGDANDDGKVAAGDALLVLRSAVGGSECEGRFCTCDVNDSASLTATDALAVLRHAVGIAAPLACNC
ncbi:MAG TPA: hypothetical protein VN634_08720 [Candidatus Limnocylindrales bacterium]|nr:hypothetical protein [Candidatus Limnocylindrales bacterium]